MIKVPLSIIDHFKCLWRYNMKELIAKQRWQYALVTGASAGIGKGFSEILASWGVNLVLVARNKERLITQSKNYIKKYGIQVEILSIDLTINEQRLIVEERLANLINPIDLLINNAGFGTNGLFRDLSLDNEQKEIDLNISTLVHLSHFALQQMTKRKNGKILNVSSISALLPGPRMATYAATKSYVTSFSESLNEELKGTGVSITVVHPGFTRTEFQSRAGMQNKVKTVPNLLWMSAENVAKMSLIAAARGYVFYAPQQYHLVSTLLNFMPRTLRRLLSTQMKQ